MMAGASTQTRRDTAYLDLALAPSAVEAMRGWILLDFGTDWCGHCVAARAAVDAWLGPRPDIDHLRVEDASGRPLVAHIG